MIAEICALKAEKDTMALKLQREEYTVKTLKDDLAKSSESYQELWKTTQISFADNRSFHA